MLWLYSHMKLQEIPGTNDALNQTPYWYQHSLWASFVKTHIVTWVWAPASSFYFVLGVVRILQGWFAGPLLTYLDQELEKALGKDTEPIKR